MREREWEELGVKRDRTSWVRGRVTDRTSEFKGGDRERVELGIKRDRERGHVLQV